MNKSLLPNERDERLASAEMENRIASAVINDLKARIAELEALLDMHYRCLDRALQSYLARNPDSESWPDGARSIMEMMEEHDCKLAAANRRVEGLVAMLTRLEWRDSMSYYNVRPCLICNSLDTRGHESDCELAALLYKEKKDAKSLQVK